MPHQVLAGVTIQLRPKSHITKEMVGYERDGAMAADARDRASLAGMDPLPRCWWSEIQLCERPLRHTSMKIGC